MSTKHLDEIDELARSNRWMIEPGYHVEADRVVFPNVDGLRVLMRKAEERGAPSVSLTEIREEVARQEMLGEIHQLRQHINRLERMVALLAIESAQRRGVFGESIGKAVMEKLNPVPDPSAAFEMALAHNAARKKAAEELGQAYEGRAV